MSHQLHSPDVAEATTYALECTELTKIYDETCVVEDLSLRVRPGQFLTLLGPSGCGKTTTLRLIAGFEAPDRGIITVNGRVVADSASIVPPEKRRVGMVFQDYALFPHVSVAENIAFGLSGNGKDKQLRTADLLHLVGLDDLGDRMPYELSGGQQQRVALARALAPQPEIILLDEPFSNLDTALRDRVRIDVRNILRDAGTTAIFVTHDQQEALSLSDQVAVMFEGRLAQKATPHALYHRPNSKEVAAFVGEANFLPATAYGNRAECMLGDIYLINESQGKIEALIRPEVLKLHPDGKGIPATVRWREFYGHDQRIGLILQDGTRLIARAGVDTYYRRDQNVGISVDQAVLAFAAK